MSKQNLLFYAVKGNYDITLAEKHSDNCPLCGVPYHGEKPTPIKFTYYDYMDLRQYDYWSEVCKACYHGKILSKRLDELKPVHALLKTKGLITEIIGEQATMADLAYQDEISRKIPNLLATIVDDRIKKSYIASSREFKRSFYANKK